MTPPLRALLVDDEAPALQRLRTLLQEQGDVQVVATARSLPEALQLLPQQALDLVFLDLRLPGGDGDGLLPHLPAEVAVIFTTAHSDYAVSAFEAGAHDYLLKPFTPARLALSLERVRQRRQAASSPSNADSDFWLESPEQANGVQRRIAFAEVLWVAAMQNYTHLQLASSTPIVLKRTLKQWEELLPAGQFLRLDRSTIVQPGRIERCERQSRHCTILRFGRDADAPALAVGSTAAARLQQALAAQAASRSA